MGVTVVSRGARLPSDFCCYLMAVLALQAALGVRTRANADGEMVRTGAWSNVLLRRALHRHRRPGPGALH